jgi:hypothetical protein
LTDAIDSSEDGRMRIEEIYVARDFRRDDSGKIVPIDPAVEPIHWVGPKAIHRIRVAFKASVAPTFFPKRDPVTVRLIDDKGAAIAEFPAQNVGSRIARNEEDELQIMSAEFKAQGMVSVPQPGSYQLVPVISGEQVFEGKSASVTFF